MYHPNLHLYRNVITRKLRRFSYTPDSRWVLVRRRKG